MKTDETITKNDPVAALLSDLFPDADGKSVLPEAPSASQHTPSAISVAESAPVIQPSLQHSEDDEVIEDPNFSYAGYQVVRGEYFSHKNEPCVTICDYKLTFNQTCLRKAPTVSHVQILINQDTKKMVVRPSQEDVKDAFPWKTLSDKPKQLTCRMFFAKIVHMMNWNPKHRYKLIGKMVKSQDEYLFVFDLTATEIYQRQLQITPDGKEIRTTAKRPVYPEEWKDQFGLPVDEHSKALQINIFDGYAVFGIKDNSKHNNDEAEEG